MRLSIFAAGLMALAASTASATTYDAADLLKVSDNPEFTSFAEKVRDYIQQAGHPCDSVDRINAYPYNAGVRAIARCTNERVYEAFLESGQIKIETLQ